MIFTIGHSNRKLADFLALLDANGVRGLADVRSVPRSRWFPHFNAPALEKALNIPYRHLPELGGNRAGGMAWFAERMKEPSFEAPLADLVDWATRNEPVAIMCSEGDPANCHRSLIAAAVRARGIETRDLV